MPIRPIDIYTLPPKSQETSQMQKSSIDRANNENYMVNQQFQDKVNKNQQKTVASKQKEEGFRFDAKEKGQNKYQDNRKKKKNQGNKGNDNLPPRGLSGSSFDISI